MNRSTDELISRLAADAAPVRRLAPPWLRASVWLVTVAVVAAGAVFLFGDAGDFWRRNTTPEKATALLAAVAVAVAAVASAYHLSVPGAARYWVLLPLPPALVWLAASSYGCLRLSLSGGAEAGDSRECLVFILGTSAPLGAFLFWRLRKAAPLNPRLVAVLAALGVAAVSAVLLQFFHPFDVSWLDFAVHGLALLLVMGVGAIASRRLAPPALG